MSVFEALNDPLTPAQSYQRPAITCSAQRRQCSGLLAGRRVESDLQQVAELVRRQSGVANDTTHRERIHGVVPRDGDDASTVGHDRVATLPHDADARALANQVGGGELHRTEAQRSSRASTRASHCRTSFSALASVNSPKHSSRHSQCVHVPIMRSVVIEPLN